MRSLGILAWSPLLAALLSPTFAFAQADGGDDDGGRADGGYSDAGPDEAGVADGGALDGGVYDAGDPLDAGLVDAGPVRPPEEGLGCTPGDGANCGALYCVPYLAFPDFGTCRSGCEDNSDCYLGRTCQDVVDKASFETLYRACLPPTTQRDGKCFAAGDPDTCAGDMSCHIARGSDSPDGVSFNCKVTCDVDEEAGADAGSCPADERCFSSRFVQGFEPDPADPATALPCTPDLCDDEGGACECSEAFDCVALASGANVCALVPGECGTPVRGMEPGELGDDGIVPFDVQCNQASGHRFCDNAGFEGTDNPGANVCFFEGQLGVEDEGICIPYCGVVDVDVNANGVIDDDERGEVYDCPSGEQCTRRLARELYLGPGPQQANGPYGVRGCSVVDCPAGTVCEACGPGEPECMELPAPVNGFDGFCIGPVLTCEYAPDYDAGTPLPVDAGSVSVDAGPGVPDAGDDPPLAEDAGSNPNVGVDAGTNGDGDDDDDRFPEAPVGPTVSADGCACTSSKPASSSPIGLGALFALGALALLSDRRRRRG